MRRILRFNHRKGLQTLLNLKYSSIIDAAEVFEYLKEVQENLDFPLALYYLKEYISSHESTSEFLHNSLSEEYIRNIFMQKPKTAPVDRDDDIILKTLREEFQHFLDSSQYVDSNRVLGMMQGSWMIEEQVQMLIKGGKMQEALETFIEKGKIEEAENFCSRQ